MAESRTKIKDHKYEVATVSSPSKPRLRAAVVKIIFDVRRRSYNLDNDRIKPEIIENETTIMATKNITTFQSISASQSITNFEYTLFSSDQK